MEAQEQVVGSGSKVFLRCNVGLFVWLVFLVIGGGLLALYYAHVGYLPDIDWHSLLVYLAVASIIGASIGTLQFLLLFLPGYIWAEIFVADRVLANELCYREGKSDVPCVRGIALRLAGC